jgi:hypothetical protein
MTKRSETLPGLFGYGEDEQMDGLWALLQRQYDLGPMTQDTRYGRPNPELWQGPPTTGEALGKMLMDYGPMPAKMAVEMAKQPWRAADAIYETVGDPTLENVTNASLQTALNVPTAKGIKAAMTALGLGYGVAAAKDSSLFDIGSDAAEPASDPLDPASRNRLIALQKKMSRGDGLSRAEREEQNSYLSILAAASTTSAAARAEAASRTSMAERGEYDRSVMRAETARDDELKRVRRFSDTEVGKVWDKTGGWGPALVGAGLGGLSRAATGGGSALKNYGLPVTAGGIGGALSSNIPLAYNAFATEPDNPEKRAYTAYARELPQSHPRKREWTDYADKMADANPVRTMAAAELYDPVKAAERMAFGAVEGIGGGFAGSDLVRLPGRIGEATGSLLAGHHRGMGRAATARSERLGVETSAAEQQQQLLLNRAAAAEAARRSALADKRTGPAVSSADDAVGLVPKGPASPPQSAVSSNQPTLPPPVSQSGNLPTAQGGGQERLSRVAMPKPYADINKNYVESILESRNPHGGAGLEDIIGHEQRLAHTAKILNDEYAVSGLARWPLDDLIRRIGGTGAEHGKMIRHKGGRFADTEGVLSRILGKSHTLAVPGAIGLGAAGSYDPAQDGLPGLWR